MKDNDFKNLPDRDLADLLGAYTTSRSDITPAIFNGVETPRGTELVEEIQKRLKGNERPTLRLYPDGLPRTPFTHPLDGCYAKSKLDELVKNVHDLMAKMYCQGCYPKWWPPLLTAQQMFEEVMGIQCAAMDSKDATFNNHMVVFPEEGNKVLKGINNSSPRSRFQYPVFFFVAKKTDQQEILENE